MRLRSDTYFEDMQGTHIDDNFKYDYKLCKSSEGCVNNSEGSARGTSRQKYVIGLHATGTTLCILEGKLYIYIYIYICVCVCVCVCM